MEIAALKIIKDVLNTHKLFMQKLYEETKETIEFINNNLDESIKIKMVESLIIMQIVVIYEGISSDIVNPENFINYIKKYEIDKRQNITLDRELKDSIRKQVYVYEVEIIKICGSRCYDLESELLFLLLFFFKNENYMLKSLDSYIEYVSSVNQMNI